MESGPTPVRGCLVEVFGVVRSWCGITRKYDDAALASHSGAFGGEATVCGKREMNDSPFCRRHGLELERNTFA